MGVLLVVGSFLGLYNRDGVESIGLDDAASKLGIPSDLLFPPIFFLISSFFITSYLEFHGFCRIDVDFKEKVISGLRTFLILVSRESLFP